MNNLKIKLKNKILLVFTFLALLGGKASAQNGKALADSLFSTGYLTGLKVDSTNKAKIDHLVKVYELLKPEFEAHFNEIEKEAKELEAEARTLEKELKAKESTLFTYEINAIKKDISAKKAASKATRERKMLCRTLGDTILTPRQMKGILRNLEIAIPFANTEITNGGKGTYKLGGHNKTFGGRASVSTGAKKKVVGAGGNPPEKKNAEDDKAAKLKAAQDSIIAVQAAQINDALKALEAQKETKELLDKALEQNAANARNLEQAVAAQARMQKEMQALRDSVANTKKKGWFR